jgi:hypothetical protein
MGFTEINDKIRDDYTKCLDTVLNGAQKVIDFMNKTACQKSLPEQSTPTFLEKIANTAIEAAIDNTPLKGIKMIKNFTAEAPIPPIKIDQKVEPSGLLNWNIARELIEKTLESVTVIRTIVAQEIKDDDLKYKLESRLYEIQKDVYETLKFM